MLSGKFSLQWVNDSTLKRPMGSVRFNLRDVQGLGEGLTCTALHLDQVHIIFVPSAAPILASLFRSGDGPSVRWRAEGQFLNVLLTSGERYILATRPTTAGTTQDTQVSRPEQTLVYRVSLANTPYTGAPEKEFWCRSYRPIRDTPAAQHLQDVSEIQVDLFWPLLQGDPNAIWWAIPDYRIQRVICEFSFHS